MTSDLTKKLARGRTERRRSQRIGRVVPVEVAGISKAGGYFREQAQAEAVSAHGALLRIRTVPLKRRALEITRTGANNWTLARVIRIRGRRPDGSIPVAVELDVPSRVFWTAG